MRYSDDELIAAIEAEESQALDSDQGQLQSERTEALKRYRGEPLGNEQEGRSTIVDKSVLDTIEWIMPSLVRIYMGGDDVGKFDPTGPEDEEACDRETSACNWYFQTKNDSYSHVSSTLKDALLQKMGYMVAFWETKDDVTTETYEGMSDEEAAMLTSDPEVTVVEHSEEADPTAMVGMDLQSGSLHDIKVERKKADEYVAVESIPPDEMLISKRHRWTSLLDCDFVQWKRKVTIGQARAEGFKVPDDAPSYRDFTQEEVSRDRFQVDPGESNISTDITRRLIDLRHTYIRMDLRNKGTPQLWRIDYVKGMKKPLRKEEADIIPFAAFSPIIFPHNHVGMSIYDLVSDLSLIKTTLTRQFLDGVYLQNSGEMAVDVNRVNLDDLLVSRPGGIKRVEGDPGSAIFPIPHNDVGPSILSAIEYVEGINERRTGVTRYSAGLDANTLNKTATGVQAIQSAANQRIELIARTLASGFKDLFLIIHAIACKHSTKPLQMKLQGNWVQIDPRSWAKRTDFSISVGLGTGNPEQQIQKLMMFGPLMDKGAQLGIVGPDEYYAYAKELLKAAGFKNSSFIHEPPKDPQTGKSTMPPPPPDPHIQVEQLKQQGQQAQTQAQMQNDAQKFQAEQQFELQKLQIQCASNERIAAMNNAAKTDLELAKLAEERALQIHVQDREDQRAAAGNQLEGAKLGLEGQKLASTHDLKTQELHGRTQTEQARMQHERALAGAKEPPPAGKPDPMETLTQHIGKLAETLARPKKIVRGPDGRAVGVE